MLRTYAFGQSLYIRFNLFHLPAPNDNHRAPVFTPDPGKTRMPRSYRLRQAALRVNRETKERADRTVLVEANQHATFNTRITRFLTTVYNRGQGTY